MMVKISLLQQWYKLSDFQIKRDINEMISFRKFLKYPDKLSDQNKIWYSHERLSKTGKYNPIFNEIKDQIMAKRIRIKKVIMQDAYVIEAEMGEYRRPRGDDAKTRRSRDGAAATKKDEKHFGYKSHTLINVLKIIEKPSVPPVNLQDLRSV